MKLELTDSKKRWLLIAFAISGWITAIFLSVYIVASNKGNEIQPFEEGLRIFATKLGDEIYKKIGNKTVAFFNFTDFQGKETSLGNYIAQSFLPFILENRYIKIVDRRHIRLTLNEHKLQGMLVEPTQTVKLGKIASSEYLLVGKTEYADDLISISAHIIDVNTNIVNMSESTTVLSDKIAYRISGGEGKNQKVSFLLFSKIYSFLKENYQWLWTAIVIPIAGWLVKTKKKLIIENNKETTE